MVAAGEWLASALVDAGRVEGEIPNDWKQGRTCYGGLSSALAWRAAATLLPDLPPLRSAQIAFVGPVEGHVTGSARLLRRGRSSAFVEAELKGPQGVVLKAIFACLDERPSRAELAAAPAPPGPAAGEIPQELPESAPAFVRKMEFAHSLPPDETGEPLLRRWVRLREREGLDATTELLLMGDGLPPAAIRLLDGTGPVSSATWTLNIVTADPRTHDGWWLLQSRSDQAQRGLSAESCEIWNSAGEAVATGSQTVSIFG
ncbi:acyl-CoA thioesterase [Croceicoccus marinus]|uniref:Thioesterase family protein n=1 Tax=Croceicoccus marinus TaxID=450378 RepID=A0A1Z1FGL5_9SPHN|nr:thioesterase family protein [Croceicoccus marinus]ARU17863.1 hypothetical protein A9D14_16150 [Croceicoccus marinus]QNE07367.1 thioesterase family protein [Croceicoccus marinus]